MATESRSVSNFDQVQVRDYGELTITQGEMESLTIDAHEDILPKIRSDVEGGKLIIRIAGTWLDKVGDALSTAFSGQWIKYYLTVKDLHGLEVRGALSTKATDIRTEHLGLQLSGAGAITFTGLQADELAVSLAGAGAINLSGTVALQRVSVSGAGSYHAPKLESQQAVVSVQGAGAATVWAVKELKASLQGVGSISYLGSPQVTKSISGLGSITPKGEATSEDEAA